MPNFNRRPYLICCDGMRNRRAKEWFNAMQVAQRMYHENATVATSERKVIVYFRDGGWADSTVGTFTVKGWEDARA